MSESEETKLALIKNDLHYIKKDIEEINQKITDGLVTKAEFDPIKRLVYGAVTVILVTILGAIVSIAIGRYT